MKQGSKAELKRSGDLSQRCRCRPPSLNNIIEQDHRFIKKRMAASLCFRSAEGALKTIDGYNHKRALRRRSRFLALVRKERRQRNRNLPITARAFFSWQNWQYPTLPV
jgi:transposase-like protein